MLQTSQGKIPYMNSGYKGVNHKFTYVFTYVYHSLMAYNQPYLVLPIRKYYPSSPRLYSELSSVWFIPSIPEHTRQLLANCKIYPDNKSLASLHTGLLITYCICLDMILPLALQTIPATSCTEHW